VFRDSRGVVHTVSSADPLSDLPPGAVSALQHALLSADGAQDLGTVLERCDTVRELLERWQDAFFAALPDEIDLEEEARWAAEAGLSLEEVEAGYEDDDEEEGFELAALDDDDGEELEELGVLLEHEGLVEDEDDPRARLPEELVAVLERELLLLPLRVRLEALVAAADLVSSWAELLGDQEKLLGHLVLAHQVTDLLAQGEPHAATGHEALAARHGALHAETGPGHAGS
jgi:hypothetical protein